MLTDNVLKRRGTLFHVLIIGLLTLATPSNLRPTAELEIEALSADEIALLEELAGWIEPAANAASLGDAIRRRHDGFEVFRTFHGQELRNAPLAALPFGPAIRRTAERHSVDALLLASVIEVESGFDPDAVSRRGATGLMQVMPSTAGTEDNAELCDPELNLDAGTRYLRHLLRLYEGDLELALAAYNAGPANVRRYGGVPFRETTRYVEKVLAVYVDHHREVWLNSDTAEQLAML